MPSCPWSRTEPSLVVDKRRRTGVALRNSQKLRCAHPRPGGFCTGKLRAQRHGDGTPLAKAAA